MSTPVHVVRTGLANVASIGAMLRRLGAEPVLTTDPAHVRDASHVVLPGVGAFAPGTRLLDKSGLRAALTDRVRAGRPTLAVCLGMQLLFEASAEGDNARGLGVCTGRAERFEPPLRTPHMGWNGVRPDSACRFIQPGDAYFANSYRVEAAPPAWACARTTHGAPFISAMERGGVLACQFHPELSGTWGERLIGRWLGIDAPDDHLPPLDTLAPRVIPCLDVRDGRIVKGVRFQGLRDAGDPVERAAAYEAQGADELVVLDVSATPEGRANAAHTVEAVRAALRIPLTVGGGVRAPEDAARLLDAGADKVGVNTAAVRDPGLVSELSQRFGAQCTVVAIDAARKADRDGWEVVVASGKERTGIDAVAWAAEAEARGAGEILLTSWDRDGTGEGYDLELLERVRAAVAVPLIASGGVRGPADLAAGVRAGADAVLAASIFHDGHHTVEEVKRDMAAEGARTRAAGAPA